MWPHIYIKNIFIQTLNDSIINDFIVLQAKRKLINSDIKSAQLAHFLGFEDPTNFTKYFKKLTGLTPKSFKNTTTYI